MASLKLRIEDYVGAVTDTDALDNWLLAGSKVVIDLIPEYMLEEYAQDYALTTTGVNVGQYRVWKAMKNGYNAPIVNSGLKDAVQDENSLHYATNRSPVAVIYGQVLFIYPDGGKLFGIFYPTVVSSATDTITGVPARMIQGVVLYASVQASLQKYSETTISASDLAFPTAPIAPSFSFTDASGEIVTLPVAPSYTKPATSFSDTNINTYINTTSEDAELAVTEIAHQKAVLEQHQMDLYNELNEVNVQVEVYKGELQKYLEDARMAYEAGSLTSIKDLEALISEYQSTLSKYQSDMQGYTSQVGAEINIAQNYLALTDKLKAEFNEFINSSIRSGR